MAKPKKILITAIGAPKKKYNEISWNESPKPVETPFSFIVVALKYDIDTILILGTKQALDKTKPHYQQLLNELNKYNLSDKFKTKEITSLNTRDEFWQDFNTVVNHPLFRSGKIELYIDLTLGYRVQPMLIFLVAYFLRETKSHIKLKKVFYGMEQTVPPHILDMTELIYLLDWLKATQLFIYGGSAQALIERIKLITSEKFPRFVEAFEDFTNAYAFNYINHLKSKSKRFLNSRTKEVKKFFRNNYPVYNQVEPFIYDFVNIFKEPDQLTVQLNSAKKNFEVGAYARSVLILRESFISLFCQAFYENKCRNIIREEIERHLINKVYFALYAQNQSLNLSENEKIMAQKTINILKEAIPEKDLNKFYALWGEVRNIRNGVGHIKNYNKNKEINFAELKNDFYKILVDAEGLIGRILNYIKSAPNLKDKIDDLLNHNCNNAKKLFVIVNEGIHPILPSLKKQYGSNIIYEILTKGNVALNEEKQIAKKCKELAEKYHDYQIYLVPGGYSYLSVTANNVLQQMMGRHPVWLQFDPTKNIYIEKKLNPRFLVPN